MTNADKFKIVFGMYSEEFWAKSEDDMLNWINSEYQEPKSKVDIQPVKHGRWIPGTLSNNKVAYECSVCLAISIGTIKPHYCPKCKAKMDSEILTNKNENEEMSKIAEMEMAYGEYLND